MNRKLMAVLVVLAAVIGAVVYAIHTKAVPLDDVADLADDAGQRVLREPMRPLRGAPRVLVFALDGVGHDALVAAVRDGMAPHISSVLGEEIGDGEYATGYAVPDVLSVLPSTTLAAWAAVFTGEPPARSGVPGNEFFVREERRFYAPAPVTVADVTDMLETYSDDLVGSVLGAPTVYERADVRSHVALAHVHRGADLLIVPDAEAIGEIALATVTGFADVDAEAEPYGELDAHGVELAVEAIAEHGIADLQVIYFPGVDLFTHGAPDPLADQREYLTTVLDPVIGSLLEAYREAGALQDTYVLFVSDHGHTPVLSDDRHALEPEGDDEPPALLEQIGFRMRPLSLELDEDEEDYQATVAYQGAFAYVYLADRSTCAAEGQSCDWSRAPRLQEDVLAVVRAFDEANRTGAHVAALQGTLDLILAREPRPPGTDALPFEVWDGARLVPIDQWLATNPRPDLLDFGERMRGLSAGPYGHRAGDVLLFAKSGDARPIRDRYYFSGVYHSWHGSPSDQDSRIPFIVARVGMSGAALRARIRAAVGDAPSQLDITPLILELLTPHAQQ